MKITEFCRMFTGIIEATGEIKQTAAEGSSRQYWIESPLWQELHIDQSLSHDGVCLTIDALENGLHRVTAIDETLRKTNLASWKPGRKINLERCLPVNGRLDGHLVQGHVDTVASCLQRKEKNGSWLYRFRFPVKFAALVIEKGSISLNGISLTVFNVKKDRFDIAVIPYTFENTNIHDVCEQTEVNLEFDIIGKYAERYRQIK